MLFQLSNRFRKLSLLLLFGLIVFYLQIILTERQKYAGKAKVKRGTAADPNQNQRISDLEFEPGKQLVREMMRFAYGEYKKHAWGKDELAPRSRRGVNFFGSGGSMALTLVDSLDTLLILGLHDEYREAAEYVLDPKLTSFDIDMRVSLFESNIRIVGGLLAAFGLTGDGRMASRAFDFAQRYLSAFPTGSVLPNREVDLMGHMKARDDTEPHPKSCITSEPGTLIMEWAYLSYIIKDATLRNKAYAILEAFQKLEGYYDGLLPKVVRIDYTGAQPGSTL